MNTLKIQKSNGSWNLIGVYDSEGKEFVCLGTCESIEKIKKTMSERYSPLEILN